MACSVLLHLLLTAVLIHVTAAGDCRLHISSDGINSEMCKVYQFCCGDCYVRRCCSNPLILLTDKAQADCSNNISEGAIGLIVVGTAFFIIAVIVSCCCCQGCCLYNTCRTPQQPTTTIVSTQYPMQPSVIQGGQYPAYQPVPTQTVYGGHPMPAGPNQTQPYTAGQPPRNQIFATGQSGNPLHAPSQTSLAYPPPTDTMQQPAYNPVYMQSPNSGH